jgi:hypothetical protein
MLAPLVAAKSVSAQRPTALKLGAAAGTLAEEFTVITSVRELADGRALITDGREQRIVVGDFRNGRAMPVGRKGGGPGEYQAVGFVQAIAGDSSIMGDFMQRRFHLFHGDRIVGQTSPDHPAVLAVQGLFTGADARGNIWMKRSAKRGPGVTITDNRDSSYVILVRRTSGAQDTIAKLLNRPTRIEQKFNDKGDVTFSSTMPTGVLGSDEQAVLFTDGTLGVARLNPFRVDWRSPTGVWTRGAPLPVAPIPIDARERAAFMERNAATYKPSANPNPIPGMPPVTPPTARDFPDVFPPFPSAAVTAGPAGTLLVRRSKSADYMGTHYFVIDRRGVLLGELSLPANETIVGASARHVYVSFKDEDDVQRVRRHVWP